MHEDIDDSELANEKRLSNKRIARALLCDENNAAESWRIFKIIAEFVSGFEVLQRYDLAVTFFGSARCGFGDKVYKQATELARKLSKAGFAIITGGGGGVMEAANKGAFEAGGPSVGLNIELPREQALNKYLNDSQGFHYFFTRKVMLSFASEVYIFMPGGFGTLDELFEIATLIQTKKIPKLPLILIGRDYWEPLMAWLRSDLYMHAKAIDKEDLELFHLCDSAEEAFTIIMEHTKNARTRTDARSVPA
ncbi:MAG TPA: TIGR00730 family Rossman fold protein [Candidatus Paceibacterota bacterium]